MIKKVNSLHFNKLLTIKQCHLYRLLAGLHVSKKRFFDQFFFLLTYAEIAATQLSWLERRASDRKFDGSMAVLGITSLCPWERHLTLIS